MGSLEVCVFLFVCACVWAIDTLLHGNMHFIPLCEAPRPESKLRPFAVKSNTPLCAVQGFLLSLSLLLNVMLFCMCIFNDISNTQGTPLHLALPQIYIFHIYTGPKFTQIPDLHGTHIYTAQIYTNPFSHIDSKKPKFTQNPYLHNTTLHKTQIYRRLFLQILHQTISSEFHYQPWLVQKRQCPCSHSDAQH